MFNAIKPMLLLLGCLLSFQGFSQSWEREVDEIQETFDRFYIGEFHEGEYLVSGDSHTLRLDRFGNLLGLGEGVSNWRKAVFRDKIYSLIPESTFLTEGDSIYGSIYDKHGEVFQSFDIPSSAWVLKVVVLNDSTFAMLNFYRNESSTYLEKYDTNGRLLKRIILSRTGTNPRNMIKTKDGRLVAFDSSSYGQIWSFDDELNLKWNLPNNRFNGLVSTMTSDEIGNLYFAGRDVRRDVDAYVVGIITKDGILKKSITLPEYQPISSPYSVYVSSIAVQENSVAVAFSTPESNDDMVVTYFDKDLNVKHTFTRSQGGFRSNIIPNNIGGYVFGFGISTDPTAESFRTEKTAIFYSLDSLCNINPTPINTIKGFVFHDNNQNTTKDSTEVGLPAIEILHLADSTIHYTEESGYFEIETLSEEGAIQILNIAPFWNTDSMTYTINSSAPKYIPLECNSLQDAMFTKELDCETTEIVLDANSSIFPSATYQWDTDENSPFITVDQVGTYLVAIRAANEYCTLASVSTFEVLEQNKDVIITQQNPLCAGQSTILTATEGFQNYLWNTGETTQTIQVNAAGLYNVQAISADTCTHFGQLEVAVAEKPKSDVLVWPTCSEDNATYFFTVRKNNAQLWLVNQDTIAQTGEGDTYTFVVPIGERLVLQVKDKETACGNYNFFLSPVCASPGNMPSFQDIKTMIYPNPFTNHFIIQRPLVEDSRVLIFNASGSLILEEKWIEYTQKEIDLKKHPSGIYLYQILSPSGVLQGKVLKSE